MVFHGLCLRGNQGNSGRIVFWLRSFLTLPCLSLAGEGVATGSGGAMLHRFRDARLADRIGTDEDSRTLAVKANTERNGRNLARGC